MKVVAVVQCTAGDVGKSTDPSDYCIEICKASAIFDEVILAFPDNEANESMVKLADLWGLEYFKGSDLNVCERICEAARSKSADIIVRVLLRQFYLDVDQVGRMIEALKRENADYAQLPSNYNYAIAADVSSFHALEQANRLIEQIECDRERASKRFSPWVFLEENPDLFKLVSVDAGTNYAPERVQFIREKYRRISSENQVHFAWNFPASSYRFIGEKFNPSWHVLDIACGRGQGVRALSEYCSNVTGIDYEQSHIDEAKKQVAGIDGVTLQVGDAENFSVGQKVDAIISLHTLEHLKHPHKFFQCAVRALHKNGWLFLEVPLLLPIPLGKPLVPWHDKEYEMQELVDLVLSYNFSIEQLWGKQRHVFTPLEHVDGQVKQPLPGRLTSGLIIAKRKD